MCTVLVPAVFLKSWNLPALAPRGLSDLEPVTEVPGAQRAQRAGEHRQGAVPGSGGRRT